MYYEKLQKIVKKQKRKMLLDRIGSIRALPLAPLASILNEKNKAKQNKNRKKKSFYKANDYYQPLNRQTHGPVPAICQPSPSPPEIGEILIIYL